MRHPSFALGGNIGSLQHAVRSAQVYIVPLLPPAPGPDPPVPELEPPVPFGSLAEQAACSVMQCVCAQPISPWSALEQAMLLVSFDEQAELQDWSHPQAVVQSK